MKLFNSKVLHFINKKNYLYEKQLFEIDHVTKETRRIKD